MGWVLIIGTLLLLLAVCLVAHGKMYERRPQVRFLTNYYLTMAVGGFMGGAVISLAAPWVFPGLYEYPIILAALGLVFWWCCPTSFPSCPQSRPSSLRWLRTGGAGILLGSIGICLIRQIKLSGSLSLDTAISMGLIASWMNPPRYMPPPASAS